MILVVSVMISITYMATSAIFPLQDATLLALDRALGFDFRDTRLRSALQPHLAQIIAFADRHALRAQDVVGGCRVKMKIR
jgi:hypothetical protein